MGKYLYYPEYSITIESIEIIFRWWSRWDLLSVQNKWLISTTFGYINPFLYWRSFIKCMSHTVWAIYWLIFDAYDDRSVTQIFWSSKYSPVSRISDPKSATCHSRTSFSGFLFPSETWTEISRPKNPSRNRWGSFFFFLNKNINFPLE